MVRACSEAPGAKFAALVAEGAQLYQPPVNVAETVSIGGQAVEMAEDQAVTPERRNAALEIACATGALLARLAGAGLKARGVRRP